LKKIAIIGTNGLPAKYGGFETLVKFLVKHLSSEYNLTVFCSSRINNKKVSEINGCKMKYINLKANGWQSSLYDFLSIYKSRNYDKVLILGASGGIFMPLLYKHKKKFILNFGGLDWKRSKWSYLTRKFLKLSEKLSIKYSKYIIADNWGIKKYIESNYNRESEVIEYGADHAVKINPNKTDFDQYQFLNKDYIFTVARIQSDNNIQLMMDAFSDYSDMPLVLLGNWDSSKYGRVLKKKYSNKKNLILLDAIYDERILNLLRSNCKIYIHGHSAGGTNPALVEAMNLSLPILAYNCNFNKYTTEGKCKYFSTSEELNDQIHTTSSSELMIIGKDMFDIAKKRYQWKIISNKYRSILNK